MTQTQLPSALCPSRYSRWKWKARSHNVVRPRLCPSPDSSPLLPPSDGSRFTGADRAPRARNFGVQLSSGSRPVQAGVGAHGALCKVRLMLVDDLYDLSNRDDNTVDYGGFEVFPACTANLVIDVSMQGRQV